MIFLRASRVTILGPDADTSGPFLLSEGKLSWQAVTWVLENSKSRVGSRLVLLSIASHSNREGMSAWPSLKTIAIEAHLSKVQVIHCIADLERLGELDVVRYGGRGKSNSYVLRHVREWVKRLNPDHSEMVNSAPKRVKSTAERVKCTLPEPSLNRPLQQPKEYCEFCLCYFPKAAFKKHLCRKVAQ